MHCCSIIDANDLLSYWNVLDFELGWLKMEDKTLDLTKALRLLLEDCLLDSRLHDGTDISAHYASGKIPIAHRNAVQQWAVQQDIADIDLAVDRSIRMEDSSMTAGAPFVTPDDFPALPQSNPSAPVLTDDASTFYDALEGPFEPWEPICDPLPPGRSYQKTRFHPSDIFRYSTDSRRSSDNVGNSALDIRDASLVDALLTRVRARDWDSLEYCAPKGPLAGYDAAPDGLCIPLPAVCPDSLHWSGHMNPHQAPPAGGSSLQRQDTQYLSDSSEVSSSSNGRSDVVDQPKPETWAQRLDQSLPGLGTKSRLASRLATLRQPSHPWAPHQLILVEKLKRRLKDIYARLAWVTKHSDGRSGPSVFFRTITGPLDLYRTGSSVLKKVMANETPHTLRQVVSCVILAESMLVASSGMIGSGDAHISDQNLERKRCVSILLWFARHRN